MLSLVVEDGMLLLLLDAVTPTVLYYKPIRIICLFECYGFSSQYEQLMR